jgi:hypothetical protein
MYRHFRGIFTVIGSLLITGVQEGSLQASNTASHHEGAAYARAGLSQNQSFLTPSSAQDKIPGYTSAPPEAGMTPDQLNGSRNSTSHAAVRVKDQLSGNRVYIDPVTDPMFVNANKAIANPTETLKKQTMVTQEMEGARDQTCIETRDEEFEVIKSSKVDIHYKKFEVSQFYNHCPNHSGWGKGIAQGCQTWNRPELMHPARNPPADYEQIEKVWTVDAHPDLEALFQAGKCRFKKEMPKEEGRDSRMIPVKYYAKVETREDWNMTEIEEHRDERHRLKRPEDFSLESFENIQVYVCSYQSSGNTCKALRQQGAVEKSSICLERMGNVCVKWQKVYRVPRPGSLKTNIQDTSRGHIEAFNADGRMNDTSYADNREGAEAIARLTALRDVGAAMPKLNTGDANALSVFRGEDNRCVSQAGNNRCPNGKGSKEPGDLVLEQKYNEGKCIRIGTYTPPTRNFGTMIGQKRTTTTFCCYESILSYVLHKGVIDQGIKSLGSPQSPDCGALTLAQLQRLQWDRVDFTPFVREVTSKVSLNAAEVGGRSATTVRSYLENQMRSQQQQARERAALR